MKTSIIILTKNAGDRFNELLDRLNKQSYRNFEILVIDSGSKDNTLKIAKERGCRIYEIPSKNFHHSKTRNLGARLSKGDYLVYLTQDALPVNNYWLENLISSLKYDNVAVVYGRQIAYLNANPMEKLFYNYFYPEKRRILTHKDAKNLRKFYLENVFTSNVNSAMKKKIWEEIKFNEGLIMAEDKDFALRALKKHCYICYEPKACVYHSHNYSIFSAFKRRFKDGISYRQVTNKSFISKNTISNYLRTYLIPEFKFIWRNYRSWFLYALSYEMTNLLGFVSGIYITSIRLILKVKQ